MISVLKSQVMHDVTRITDDTEDMQKTHGCSKETAEYLVLYGWTPPILKQNAKGSGNSEEFRVGMSDDDEIAIEGELELHGETQEIELTAEREDDEWVARFRLRQADFGIRPFKALMGALKIQPHVDVELRTPA